MCRASFKLDGLFSLKKRKGSGFPAVQPVSTSNVNKQGLMESAGFEGFVTV
ncbi:hypothetical protein KX729_17330 [Rhizobium sp. XQZ8]|uniref:hypothetical protein n=1 Tax=Rhizobium populisoli TaxID=2859785 RepID=UPI001CA5B866|nr:hypothetical protein [Rhizobium populisoli]MBW6423223.1 hypothetical protein [Rhizobium populisoli]